MIYFNPVTNKNDPSSVPLPFPRRAPERPRVPDTRMLDPDPRVQRFLDCFRYEYERKHGVPTPHDLWAHQLPEEEQKKLSKEELKVRVAPWHRALWSCLIAEAMTSGTIDNLPDATIAMISRIFGHRQDTLEGTPGSPPPAPGRGPT
jgi:hypothetical protein